MLAAIALSAILHIEKATTPQQQARGLSYRKSLAENQAMLFIFPKEQNLAFWMHEMNFLLDIIWLDKSCKIIDISANQKPCEKNNICPMITPQKPAQYVLEVNAGFAKRNNIKINNQLDVCS